MNKTREWCLSLTISSKIQISRYPRPLSTVAEIEDWSKVLRVRHGFANLRGWARTGRAGTGTGRAEVTRPKPIPVPQVWWVWFRRDDEGITLFATSKREWSRGREGLGVETGVNEGDRAPGIEMEGIPLLL